MIPPGWPTVLRRLWLQARASDGRAGLSRRLAGAMTTAALLAGAMAGRALAADGAARAGASSASPAGLALAGVQSGFHASFGSEPASIPVRRVADWIAASGDNQGLPFVIVDKVDAKVFAFDAQARLRGSAPALLGLTVGDDSTPGVGDKKLADIGPSERTTPAGRFVASLGQDLGEKDVLWVDYKDAIALHRVITTNPKEHRLQRLATPTVLDKRISYGCINVPVAFYETAIKPAFTGTNGVVYVLPEKNALENTFRGYH